MLTGKISVRVFRFLSFRFFWFHIYSRFCGAGWPGSECGVRAFRRERSVTGQALFMCADCVGGWGF